MPDSAVQIKILILSIPASSYLRSLLRAFLDLRSRMYAMVTYSTIRYPRAFCYFQIAK